jgi:hypothetical protein
MNDKGTSDCIDGNIMIRQQGHVKASEIHVYLTPKYQDCIIKKTASYHPYLSGMNRMTKRRDFIRKPYRQIVSHTQKRGKEQWVKRFYRAALLFPS